MYTSLVAIWQLLYIIPKIMLWSTFYSLEAVKGNLTCVTLEHHHINQLLIPGKKICFGCVRKLKSGKVEEDQELNDPDYIPPEDMNGKLESINANLHNFGMSPVKRSSSMSKSKYKAKSKSKLEN